MQEGANLAETQKEMIFFAFFQNQESSNQNPVLAITLHPYYLRRVDLEK
jgi:hypothetical protein